MWQKLFLILFILAIWVYPLFAQQNLIMIGGGKRTDDVLRKIVELSGGENSKILVITWATNIPNESFEAFKKDIEKVSKITLVKSPSRPLNEQSKAEFLQQLKEANGIFFTGGDQNRVMEVLQDETLLKTLQDKYNGGTLFAGTSAGTAIMSEIMITGEGDFTVIEGKKVQTGKGIGLVKDAIVDQHFVKRSRHNRLLGLVLQYPKLLGIGIDEDTAVWLKDNRLGEVLGDSQVIIFDAAREPLKVYLLKKSEKFDFRKRKKINER
jgi:cyanophycinase